MRDAPEPTGEEVEDADMELPKIYEPIGDKNAKLKWPFGRRSIMENV